MGGAPSMPIDDQPRLQVIAAGYSRTGTTSISLAIEHLLGGPVFHGGNHIFQRNDGWLRDWCRTLSARPDRALFLSHLRRMTVGFVGVADTPAYCVMPELLALYPDAKVVLVTRDRERWYRSMAPIMKNIAAAPLWVLDVVLWPCPTWCWLPEYFRLVSRSEDKRMGIEFTPDFLDRHNDWVRNNAPKDRFLEMDLKDGWKPLADFLGVPVPDVPFPRVNDAAEAGAVTKRIFREALLSWAAMLVVGVAVVWQLVRFWRS